MKKFSSVSDAFQWWATTVYPTLPASRKAGRLKTAWRDFTYDQGISEKRMASILSEFGKLDVKTLVTYELD